MKGRTGIRCILRVDRAHKLMCYRGEMDIIEFLLIADMCDEMFVCMCIYESTCIVQRAICGLRETN
jgi:hypothetical protein